METLGVFVKQANKLISIKEVCLARMCKLCTLRFASLNVVVVNYDYMSSLEFPQSV